MQLIFSDRFYASGKWEEGKYLREIAAELSEVDPNVEAHPAQIGHSADFPSVLVELFQDLDWTTLLTAAGAGGLFFAGDKINKSVEGWIAIARKVHAVIQKFKPVRIDERAVALLVLTDLGDEAARSLTSLTLRVEVFMPTPWNGHRLSKRPDALYIVTARTKIGLYVYGVKSNGRVEFKHTFDTGWEQFDRSKLSLGEGTRE